MKKLLLPFYLIHCLGYAQLVSYSPGGWYTGKDAGSQSMNHSFSFLSNQAVLAGLTQSSAGVYAEQKYGLKDLATYTATAAIAVPGGGIGLALGYSGFNDFNQNEVALAYGKDLGRVKLGIQCHYQMLHMAGYGNDAAVGIEIGSLWPLGNRCMAGVHIVNPVGGRFRYHTGEKLPSAYQLGFGYEASNQLILSAQIGREENQPVNVQTDIQYIMVPDRLFMQAGLNTATALVHWGMGWKWKNCRTDILMKYHTQLGITPALLLIFYGKRKNEP